MECGLSQWITRILTTSVLTRRPGSTQSPGRSAATHSNVSSWLDDEQAPTASTIISATPIAAERGTKASPNYAISGNGRAATWNSDPTLTARHPFGRAPTRVPRRQIQAPSQVSAPGAEPG